MQRSCEQCGAPFEATRGSAQFCGATCRQRAVRARKKSEPQPRLERALRLVESKAAPSGAAVADLPGSLAEVVRQELGAKAATSAGYACVLLARRIDRDAEPSGSAYAALHKQLTVMLAALVEPEPVADDAVERAQQAMADGLAALA